MSDFVEWNPKRHGQKPPYWEPGMPTSVDGLNFSHQPNWAWIAGSTYYVPREAVELPRIEPEPAQTDADRIEALTAENERLRTELLEWLDKTKWVRQTCQTHELGLHRADILRNRIEALTTENERLREALRVYAGPLEWTQEGGWGMFPVWADGYPGGVYIDDDTLDFGDAARAALEKQP
jgi:hypothetical protein